MDQNPKKLNMWENDQNERENNIKNSLKFLMSVSYVSPIETWKTGHLFHL